MSTFGKDCPGPRHRVLAAAALLCGLPAGAGGQTGNLDVGDATIYYESAGRGVAVVLIHGWALNLREWDDQVAALKSGYRVVAFDRRGFGKSTGFADVSADPGDLGSLLDTLGIRSAVLIGHSAGSQVAYRFAAAFPDRVLGLVLYGAGAPPRGFAIPGVPAPPDAATGMRYLQDIARGHGLDSVRTMIRSLPGFTTLRAPEVEARIDAMWAAYSGKDLLEDHPPSGRFPQPHVDDVKRWPIPTAFVAGEDEDPYTRLIGDSLSRWMPNARSGVIPGGGHGVHLQQPERFNAGLLAFLTELTREGGETASRQGRMLDVGDAAIHYDVSGQGEAIVFLHGWAQNLTIWDEQVAAFAPRFRVVRLDRRGYGKSTGHSDPTADPADLLLLLDSLGISSAVVVGLSSGAGTALRFAVAYPGRVRGLVLYGLGGAGIPDFPGRNPGRRQGLGFAEIARKHGMDSLGKAVFASPLGWSPPDRPWRLDSLPSWWKSYSGRDLLDPKPPSGRVPAPRWDQLPHLRTPTLLLNGDHDVPMALLVADSLERRLPHVRRVTITNGGHGAHFQQPEQFNRALLDFVASLQRGRAP